MKTLVKFSVNWKNLTMWTISAEDVPLSELRITTTYREQSIDAILETIGTAFGLNVRKREELYYLNP